MELGLGHLDDLGQRLELIHAERIKKASHRTTDNDEECRRVIQRAERGTLQDHAEEDAEKTQAQADDCRYFQIEDPLYPSL